jgi:hypothetical protein
LRKERAIDVAGDYRVSCRPADHHDGRAVVQLPFLVLAFGLAVDEAQELIDRHRF